MDRVPTFHLSKAPLEEVSLYLECQCNADYKDIDCEALQEKLAADFSAVRIMPPKNEQEKGPIILAESVVNKKALMLRPTLFSFTLTGDYKDWKAFVSESLKFFPVYVDFFKLGRVFRVGVRSVNKFPTSLKLLRVSDIFNAPPMQPGESDSGLIDCLVKKTMLCEESGLFATTIASVRRVPQVRELRASYDLDVFAFELKGVSPDDFGEILGRIHNQKDQIFFSTVNSRVLETLK